MGNKELPMLRIGENIVVKTIDGEVRSGTIEAFGEHIIILSSGVHRYVAKKQELITKGYRMPPYKPKYTFCITN